MSMIDDRIVRLSFDKTGFTENISESLRSLNDLSRSLKTFEHDSNIYNISDSIDIISDRFSSLGIIGATVLSNITNKLTDMGVNLVKSLTTGQIASGFSKYEQSSKKIIATMQQTDKDIVDVQKHVDELSWYSDATSYSFTAMTSALASFSSQGLDLKESIPIIMGIGNACSYAGAAAEEMSGVFNVYAKAMAQGNMDLRQWYQLQNTYQVGTLKLKQQFIDTAVAVGTLKDEGNGVYKAMKLVDKQWKETGLEVTLENFQSTLSDQKGKWLTTDVMKKVFGEQYGGYSKQLNEFTKNYEKTTGQVLTLTEAMEKYDLTLTEEERELSKMGKAFLLSATRARTFSEAVGAVKDAASTTWNNIFRSLFGNAQEAAEMWTSFSDYLNSTFLTWMYNLDSMLNSWKEFEYEDDIENEIFIKIEGTDELQRVSNIVSGRNSLLNSIRNIAKALENLIKPVKEVFREFFPPKTARDLINFTLNFEAFTNKLIIGEQKTEEWKTILRAFFSLISAGFKTIDAVYKTAIKPLMKAASNIFSWIFKLTVKMSSFMLVGDKFNNILSRVSNTFTRCANGITSFVKGLKPLRTDIDKLKGVFSSLGEKINFVWKSMFGKSFDVKSILSLELVYILFRKLDLFLYDFKRKIRTFDFIGKFSEVLDDLSWGLNKFTSSLNASYFKKIAVALGIFAGALFLLSLIDQDRLIAGLLALSTAMSIFSKNARLLTGSMKPITAINDPIKSLMSTLVNGMQYSKFGTMMIKFSGSVLILAGALVMLSRISVDNLAKAVVALAILIKMMKNFASSFSESTINKDLGKLSTSMVIIATGIAVMAGAFKLFENVRTEDIIKGTSVMAASLLMVSLFAKKTKTSISMGSKGISRVLGSMIPLAASLYIFAKTLSLYENISWESLSKGSLVLVGALVAMSLFAKSLGKMKISPFVLNALPLSFMALAASMVVLAIAFQMFSDISFNALGIGGASVGMLLIFATAITNLSTFKLIANSVAIGVLAGSLMVLALALKLLSTLSLGGLVVALGGLTAVFIILAGASLLFSSIAGPILLFAGVTALLSASLYLLGVSLIKAGEGIAYFTALGSAAILGMVTMFQETLNNLPKLKFAKLATFLGEMFGEIIASLTGTIVGGILGIVKGLSDSVDEIVSYIFEFLIKLFDSLSNELKNNGTMLFDKILETLFFLVYALVSSLINSVKKLFSDSGEMGGVKTAISLWASNLWTTISTWFSTKKEDIREWLGGIKSKVLEFFDNIKSKFQELWDKISEIWDSIKEWILGIPDSVAEFIDNVIESFKNFGSRVVEGFKNGIKNRQEEVIKQVSEMSDGVSNTAAARLGIHSPSKVFEKIGKYVCEGFANGISNNSKLANNEIDDLSGDLSSNMENALNNLYKIISMNIDADPVISPIVNLDNVMAASNAISRLLGSSMIDVDGNLNAISTDEAKNNLNEGVNFTQNIYSPKALSRIDIYRQTKNQLAAAKGMFTR